jgi:ADP-glucose pyrophosphorylase
MRELSNKRAVAAMPFAGSYRSIDFVWDLRYYMTIS